MRMDMDGIQCANAPPPSHLSTSLSALASLACQLSTTTITTTSANNNNKTTPDSPDDPADRFPLDPEKRRYIFQLLKAIYEARFVAGCYNVFILGVILVLALLHWRRTRRDQQKWRWRLKTQLKTAAAAAVVVPSTTGSSSSSSSSTLGPGVSNGGNITPQNLTKAIDVDPSIDVERLPLLTTPKHPQTHHQQHQQQKKNTITKTWVKIRRKISSFLTHQPPPIPFLNKTLPPNGTSLLILSYLITNLTFHLTGLTYKWSFFFVFADKAGLMFVVNLPLLYLLAAKNQPLRKITGYSYESLNIFHRRVGEYMCFLGLVHFTGMILWQFVISEEWLRRLTSPGGVREYFNHPVILEGLGAFISYEMLFFTSLGSFRMKWYELFLACHVGMQILALGFLWLHFHTSRLYVGLSLGIFLVDRFVWRLLLKRADIVVDLVVLEDGRTLLLSGDWDIPDQNEETETGWFGRCQWWVSRFWGGKSVIHGWKPTDHVFLTVPDLGRSHSLQAHPFTIASAAPAPAPASVGDSEGGRARHAWLSLLIRAQDGFTEELLRYAQTHSRVSVRLDGPYGSSHALDMLRASDVVILVAGGSGIAVTFPLAWALVNDAPKFDDGFDEEEDEDEDKLIPSNIVTKKTRSRAGLRRKQSIHMIWLTHSRSHRSWIPQDRLDEMVRMGLHLVMPEPTEEAGRPDVAGLVEGWIHEEGGSSATETETETEEEDGRRAVGVVCSGPDGLNRLVRNVCADAMVKVDEGVDIRVAVEKFGW